MGDEDLLENDFIVAALRSAARSETAGFRQVPDLLKRVISEQRWQVRVLERTGDRVVFTRFEDFVTTGPLEGMGADLAMLHRICAQDKEALDLLDQATQRSRGGPNNTDGHNQYTEVNDDNVHIDRGSPTGNSRSRALRRLRQQRPDLHARLLSGDLTPHAAMLLAGFRRPTLTVPTEPEALARTLRKHLSADQIAELVTHLTCGNAPSVSR